MKFGRAPSTNLINCCTRRQCQHSPAAPTGARGDPQPSPPEGGRLGALAGRESAARSSCSSGSQAWPAIAYGCDIPNFAACSPVVQQHDYGKDHRGTLQHARSTRDRVAEESTAGMANKTFKMGVLRHPYGAGRATGGHTRPRRPGTSHVATLGGHVAQLNDGQAAKKVAVEAQIGRTDATEHISTTSGANCPNRPANRGFLSRTMYIHRHRGPGKPSWLGQALQNAPRQDLDNESRTVHQT